MIQVLNFGLAVLLSVFGFDANAWGQRSFRDEIALGFGLSKPAVTNEYGEIDLLAVALMMLVSTHLKTDLKHAAALVRDYWREWLEGVAVAERLRPGALFSKGICFVVVANADKTEIKAEVGPCEEVINKFSGADMVPLALPLDLVVRRVRESAKEAGLSPPKHFCPGRPDSAEFKSWITEIEAYRKFALIKGIKGRRRMAPAE
jgi:hypothetical protein